MNRRDFLKKSVIGSIILPFFGSKKETLAELYLKERNGIDYNEVCACTGCFFWSSGMYINSGFHTL
jgi:hypothetical protein